MIVLIPLLIHNCCVFLRLTVFIFTVSLLIYAEYIAQAVNRHLLSARIAIVRGTYTYATAIETTHH